MVEELGDVTNPVQLIWYK